LARVQLVEVDRLTAQEREALESGDPDPFGNAELGLCWRDKDRFLAFRDSDGHLAAAAGLVIANAETSPDRVFAVVGIGGVIVAQAHRGQGLARDLVEEALHRAANMGPELAMLFCRRDLVGLYEQLGFDEIAEPVCAEQPGGQVQMPLPAMWRRLYEGAQWPPGHVTLHGLPF